MKRSTLLAIWVIALLVLFGVGAGVVVLALQDKPTTFDGTNATTFRPLPIQIIKTTPKV